jgi:hypothetical protein
MKLVSLLLAWGCFAGLIWADTIDISQSNLKNVSIVDSEAILTRLPVTQRLGAGSLKRYSPGLTGALSIVPGLGQAYTKHYARAGLFLATEGIMAGVAAQRSLDYSYYARQIGQVEDTANLFTTRSAIFADSGAAATNDSARSYFLSRRLLYDSLGRGAGARVALAEFDRREAQVKLNNTYAWMAGCYVFNILDAIQSSNHFADASERSPTVAGWLSAIPFLGLGQIYNGSLRKAGLLLMVQGSLGFVVYNNISLMRDCERHLGGLHDLNLGLSDSAAMSNEWAFRRRTAVQNWNTFLWYGIMFYFYGIFDAIVDAHLHDAPAKMRLEPDLSLTRDGASLAMRWNF